MPSRMQKIRYSLSTPVDEFLDHLIEGKHRALTGTLDQIHSRISRINENRLAIRAESVRAQGILAFRTDELLKTEECLVDF